MTGSREASMVVLSLFFIFAISQFKFAPCVRADGENKRLLDHGVRVMALPLLLLVTQSLQV